ncbi:ABC transporter permease [Phaeobacter sp. HF9A]|uniref:ABC transporter permease n=1 Tax=Phaeobacter sp. HF9A TaxID=2721561 RepID=UPI00142F8D73|nr:ABC transporter permease [Phaeobacter sp. HF9A]NIZ12197.1 ABC transporter permease [Phaeobacter sp. HF9A]
MFKYRTDRSALSRAVTLFEVVFHSVVRSVRSKHNNAFLALGSNITQAVMFVLFFYVMFTVLGMRSASIRGDFLLYMMSGVFLFMVHTKTLGAVVGAEGPSSPMMQHAPMNTTIAILSAAIGALYVQVLSMLIILFAYHVAFKPIHIEEPIPAFGMLLLAWASGGSIGLLLYVIKPWFPGAIGIISTVYQRSNMLFSGKMVLASSLPGYMLPMFIWNPLFHTIDQARGYIFLNYTATVTWWMYTVWVTAVFLVLGMMGEFYTRRAVSLSWSARR